ncbi:MAG: apolipoprotein N-acyltransferase [Paracoccaceae bacterium]
MRPRLPAFLHAPARPGWRLLAACALLGAVTGLGQVPVGWWLAALAGLAGVIWAGARAPGAARAGWQGFAAGFGFACVTLYWIVEPFFVEPEVYGWMAPFALVLMAAGMGLFWAVPLWLGHRIGWGLRSRAFAMALALAGADAVRSYVFTGFPWVLQGHIWIDTPLSQAGALFGPIGLGLLSTLLALFPVVLVARGTGRGTGRGPAALVAAVPLAVAGGLWMAGQRALSEAVAYPEAPIRLRLVQPNAPQHLKWLPEYRLDFFYRHLDLTAEPAERRPDLVIWPETAVPFLLDRPGDGLEMIAEAAGGVPVALGVQRSEGLRYFNSLAVIGPDAVPRAVYDKFHLVPFGEYVPFGDLAARFGLSAFAAQAGNGYTAGPGAALLDLGDLGRVQPLICYEAVFPQDLRAVPARPDWLLQATNDAWFGQLSGPWQHLAQARMRAIETGLPLARAANTGISAMIDARGRVVAALGLDRAGVVDADLPAALPVTPYARLGDLPVLLVLIGAMGALAAVRRKAIDPARRTV